MTRGVQDVPKGPGKASSGRAASRARAFGAMLVLVSLALTLTDRALGKRAGEVEGVLADVRIVGNVSVPTEDIKRKLLCRPGKSIDQRTINADMHSLMGTNWFEEVKPFTEEEPPNSGKIILTFVVKECPVLKHVEFRGRSRDTLGRYVLKQKEIEETTGLKVGNRADVTRTLQAVGQIQRLYAEKGYDLAEVVLVEGGHRGDTRVVIQIFEGPRHKVGGIEFEGNTFATSATLRTKIKSRTPILGIGGNYHRDTLEQDIQELHKYYQDQGFYEVKIQPVTRPGADIGDMRLTFVISEGVRYKIRKVEFEGNKQLTVARLRDGLMVHPGEPALRNVLESDQRRLLSKYYALGCIQTQILPEPRFTNEPGVIDVVYRIEESNPVLLADLIVRGNERTKDKVIRREAVMAGLLPGEVLNKNRIDIYQKRLAGTGYFPGSQQGGAKSKNPIDIQIINVRPGDQPYGEGTLLDLNNSSLTRMQDPGPEIPALPPAAPPAMTPPATNTPPPVPGTVSPFGEGGLFSPPPDTPITVPTPTAPPNVPPMPPGGGPTASPLGATEPPGITPSVPGMNATDVGPDRGDAFANRQYADVLTSVEEAPTGRFMLGFGASGSQGLSGQVSIVEKNFDLFNVPRSWAEISNGQAFRGGGQTFQVSAFVGTLFNQFTLSLTEPYLFDLPIGAGATGYYRTRIYPDWTEDRGGGRFWIGRQFGTSIYADLAVRAESIDFFGYKTPAPADYLAATGFSSLFSIRPSIRYDNRNSPFLPTSGQYVQAAFEQAWGTFSFPKFDLEARTYFTLGSRPDGSGPRTLELRGAFGITGTNTPVYERYFAGYYGTLRGFQYRGVGPFVLGSNAGGLMQALGSVEYMFPLTASDSVRQVIFCDFGTVEPHYEFTNIRVAVGTGLRVTLPMFGPLPLAFDLGFPVVKAPGDRVNYFSFMMGASY